MEYQWLTMQDQSSILDDPYTPELQILQRFGLANVYFATIGTDVANVTSLPAGVIQCDSGGQVPFHRIAQHRLQNAIPSVLRCLSELNGRSLESNLFGTSPMPSCR